MPASAACRYLPLPAATCRCLPLPASGGGLESAVAAGASRHVNNSAGAPRQSSRRRRSSAPRAPRIRSRHTLDRYAIPSIATPVPRRTLAPAIGGCDHMMHAYDGDEGAHRSHRLGLPLCAAAWSPLAYRPYGTGVRAGCNRRIAPSLTVCTTFRILHAFDVDCRVGMWHVGMRLPEVNETWSLTLEHQ